VNGDETDTMGEEFIRLRIAVVLDDFDIRSIEYYAGWVRSESDSGDKSHNGPTQSVGVGICGRTESELKPSL